MAVAEIPRLARAVVHDAVVPLGGGHHASVLERLEEALAVPLHIVDPAFEQVDQGGDDIALADREASGQRRLPVKRRVLLPRSETAVAQARHPGGGGIDVVEIAQHGVDRGVEAVEIEPVEADPRFRRAAGIVLAQPFDQLADLLVAPHPGREARERHVGGRPLAGGRAGCGRSGRLAPRPASRPRPPRQSNPFFEPARESGARGNDRTPRCRASPRRAARAARRRCARGCGPKSTSSIEANRRADSRTSSTTA